MTRLGLLPVKTAVWLQALAFLFHIPHRLPNDRRIPLGIGRGISLLHGVSPATTLCLAQHNCLDCLGSRVRIAAIDCHQ
jgi:hypothetical protein